MLKGVHPARRVMAAAAALLSVASSACDVKQELLAPENPGIIDASSIDSPAAADALRIGAFGRLKLITAGGVAGIAAESFWLSGGLIADEWKSSDLASQRNETDQRSVQISNSLIRNAYGQTQSTRGYIKTAIDFLNRYTPDSTRNIGQMNMALSFTVMTLAEKLCSGMPMTYTHN